MAMTLEQIQARKAEILGAAQARQEQPAAATPPPSSLEEIQKRKREILERAAARTTTEQESETPGIGTQLLGGLRTATEFVDKPFRAGVQKALEGPLLEAPARFGSGVGEQIRKQLTPGAPDDVASFKEIAGKQGLSTKETIAIPLLGAVSPAGIAGLAGDLLSPSSAIPIPGTKVVAAATKNAAKTIGKGLAGAVKAVGKGADAVTDVATRAMLQTGEVLTQGALNADKARAAIKALPGRQLVFPYLAKRKIGKEIGAFREALQKTPVALPGGRDVLENVKELIESTALRTGELPGAGKNTIKVIDNILANPASEVLMNQVDDIIQTLDDKLYTAAGVQTSQGLKNIWGPVLNNTRATLDKSMAVVPEGELFKGLKTKYANLSQAGGRRSKLLEGGSLIASVIAPWGFVARLTAPSTYYQIAGAAKMAAYPGKKAGQVANEALKLAAEIIEAKTVKEAQERFFALATEYPLFAEKLARGLVTGEVGAPVTEPPPENRGLTLPNQGLRLGSNGAQRP